MRQVGDFEVTGQSPRYSGFDQVRCKKVTSFSSSNGTATYAYDALGRRISRAVGGVTTHYAYSGTRVIEEYDSQLRRQYVHGNYLDEVLHMRTYTGPSAFTDYWYHTDDMYNTTAVTDDAGAVVERYEYKDYGAPEFYDAAWGTRTATAIGNAILFTGRPYDSESGWYQFRARYLQPGLGRFTTRDPKGIWGDMANLGNGYTYANNNPWSYMDPFGMEAGSNKEITAGDLMRTVERALLEDGATGQMMLGLVDALKDLGLSVWELGKESLAFGRDPRGYLSDKLAALKQVISNPGATADALKAQIMEAAGNPRTLGKVLGGALLSAVGVGAIKGLDAAGDAMKVLGKAAKVAEKAGDVTINPPGKGGIGPVNVGRAGEAAAGITKNTDRIPSYGDTAAYRVPDVLDHENKIIGEVKNVETLSYTAQLRDSVAYAKEHGYTFELWVRPTTKLSGPLQEAISKGDIIPKKLE